MNDLEGFVRRMFRGIMGPTRRLLSVRFLSSLFLSWWLGHAAHGAPTHVAQDSEHDLEIVPQVAPWHVFEEAISPDGRLIATGGWDGCIRLWHERTGTLMRSWVGHEGKIGGLIVDPDGLHVWTGGEDAAIRKWELRTGRKVAELEGHEASVADLSISSSGHLLVSGDAAGRMIVWNAERGRPLAEVVEERPFTALAVAADGATVAAVVDVVNEMRAWRLERGGRRVVELETPRGGYDDVAISPDGRYAVVPRRFLYHAQVVDLTTGEVTRLLEEESGKDIQTVAFSHDGQRVATASAPDGRIILWDLSSGERLWALEGLTAKNLHFTEGDERLVADGDTLDVESGTMVRRLGRLRGGMQGPLSFSPGGGTAASGCGRFWSLETLSLERTVESEAFCTAFPSADGWRQLYTGGYPTDSIFLRDVDTGEVLREIQTEHEHIWARAVSPDGRLAMVGGDQGKLSLWGLDDGTHLHDFGAFYREDIRCVSFSPDGRLALSGSDRPVAVDLSSTLVVWDVESGAEVVRLGGHVDIPTPGEVGTEAHLAAMRRAYDDLEGHSAGVKAAAFSPDGERVVSGGGSGQAFVWDVAGGSLVASLEGHSDAVLAAAFSPDGATVVTGGEDRSVRLWDAESGRLLRTFTGHEGPVDHAGFLPDGRLLYSSASDGTTRLWRIDGQASLILVAKEGEWLAVDDLGQFSASRNGGSLAAVVRGLEVFQLDQLALRNNRPDRLLERIGLGSPALIDHYRSRHERRLDKAGLTPDELSVALDQAPESRIEELTRQGSVAELIAQLDDPGGELSTYHLYVNGVPLFGSAGRPLAGASQRITERIELTPGTNRIGIEALNRAGASSLRDTRVVEVAHGVPGDLYFLGFGVSAHGDPDLDLAYAHKDVLDVAAALDQRTTAFDEVHTQVYVDEQVTLDAIAGARSWLDGAGVGDTVVVMLAGHGTYTDDAVADYHFVVHDTDLDRLRETGASFELIEGLLDGIAPRRKLLLLDTCASGELSADDRSTLVDAGGARGLRGRTIRGLEVEREDPSPAPRPFLFERDRYIYNDLFRRTGAIVLSSSLGSELSYEQDTLENGVFTEELLAALTSAVADADQDGAVSTDELREYVAHAVAARTGGLQHPTVDRDNLAGTFTLPILLGDDPPLRIVPPSRHHGPVLSLSMSTDGSRVLTGGEDRSVRLWELDTGALIHNFLGHPDAVHAVAMAPDGRIAVSGGENGRVRFWDTDTGGSIPGRWNRPKGVTDLDFSPDGRRLLLSSHDHLWDDLVLWSMDGPRVLREWKAHNGGVHAVAFTPDGSMTLSAGIGATPDDKSRHSWIQVWETGSLGSRVRSLADHSGWINDIEVSPDGSHVLSASSDDTVRLWDLESGDELWTFRGDDRVNCVSYLDGAGRLAVSGDEDGGLVVHDLAGSVGRSTRLEAHSGGVTDIEVSADLQRAVTSGEDGDVILWDTATWERIDIVAPETEAMTNVAMTSDGRFVVLSGRDDDVRIWDLAAARMVRRSGAHAGDTPGPLLSPDGRLRISAADDGTTRISNLETGRSITFAGSGDRWFVYSDDGYYHASSAEVAEGIWAVQDRRSFRLSRLAAAKHRPDKLLEVAGLADAEAIARSRSARARELRRLGLDPDQVSGLALRAPEVEIVGVETDPDGARITFHAHDDEVELCRYRVLLDGVPQNGPLGNEVSGSDVTLVHTLPPSNEVRRVEIEALNSVGIWSSRARVLLEPPDEQM